jgi:hypothetical protein
MWAFDAVGRVRRRRCGVQVGRQIFDSRGLPAVECEVMTYKGTFRASCPAGDFGTRPYETLELRDAGEEFHGQGVQRAVHNINHVRHATPSLFCRVSLQRGGRAESCFTACRGRHIALHIKRLGSTTSTSTRSI